ncbi:lysylphosphatidylglycerol synthase domain-containing protein [Streptomyces echinoruber]|uniref:Membrane protein n=1 Tax=Streptomyces echinoruber TaxID=68898 RepID=A0A918R0P8_9ACTN|nr:lysylphosphatidylglycerol synthase domain-containing protein [Streptomyces echinoruber]GGZ79306.1 membrane protein [Streptomyces echinoruber]
MTTTEPRPDLRAAGRGIRRGVLSGVFFLAVLAGLWLSVHDGTGTLAKLVLRPRSIPYLVAAFAANAVGVALTLVSWRALLDGLRPVADVLVAARIYFTSFLGKYIPGRVWGLLAQLRLGREAGYSAPAMSGVFLLNLAVGTLTGLALGLTCGPGLLGGQAWWLLLPAGAVGALFVRPGLLTSMVRVAARLARRSPPAHLPTDSGLRRSMVAATASWLVAGLHLWSLAVLFGADALRALPLCVGGFALATALSSLAVVLPDGWGAREAILMLVLSGVLPWPAAGAVAVASRIICTASEVAVAGGALLLVRGGARRRHSGRTHSSSSRKTSVPHDTARTGKP